MKKLIVAFVLLGLALYVAGCDSGPKLVPAEGVIKLKGAPLPTASIVVQYPDGNSASAVSDAQGKFQLNYGPRVGAVPGADLKVGVVKLTSQGGAAAAPPPTAGTPTSEEEEAALSAQLMKAGESGTNAGTSAPKSEIDIKYNNPEASGLKLTIPESGSKELVIDIP